MSRVHGCLSPAHQHYLDSISDPSAFWHAQARLIDWAEEYREVCDYSNPPFAKWFAGGKTNLCHNAVDRHLPGRASQTAIYFISSETGEEKTLTYRELATEVNRMASIFGTLGVRRGDRIIIYMPMIVEA